MWARGFRYCFTPLPGCFSPFPHGTGSLSVTGECLALEGGPPCFGPGFTCPGLLWAAPRGGRGFAYGALTRFGRPSHAVPLPRPFLTAPGVRGPPDGAPSTPGRQRPRAVAHAPVWADPLSLAATRGISVDFSSSGYLDVSVPRVVLRRPMDSGGDGVARPTPGSPIRASADRRAFAPPRSLSQLAAPFVDFQCQGIRPAPSVSSRRVRAADPSWILNELSSIPCFSIAGAPLRAPPVMDLVKNIRAIVRSSKMQTPPAPSGACSVQLKNSIDLASAPSGAPRSIALCSCQGAGARSAPSGPDTAGRPGQRGVSP